MKVIADDGPEEISPKPLKITTTTKNKNKTNTRNSNEYIKS